MIDIEYLFKQGGKSKKSPIQTDLDSIRSTWFGKFYEGIVASWLQEFEGYRFQKGKPCVYWIDTPPLDSPTTDLGESLNIALQNKRKNVHSNSDGLFEKNEKYYLWEAKNWAKWNEGKSLQKQVRDLLGNSPWLLAKQVKHNGHIRPIDGILFSWWQRFEGCDELAKEITNTIDMPFAFYFTSEIVEDCRKNKYTWYNELIEEQKRNIDVFTKGLLGEEWVN